MADQRGRKPHGGDNRNRPGGRKSGGSGRTGYQRGGAKRDSERHYGGERRGDGERRYSSDHRRDGERRYDREGRGERSRRFDGERRGDGEKWRGEHNRGDGKSHNHRGAGPRRDGERRPQRRGDWQKPEESARLQPSRPEELRAVRTKHIDPEIPESITSNDLHPAARKELKTLAKDTAEFVARHLAMAAILIDTDPELAHQHAISASRRGGRIGIVRETLAITAYETGDFALALRELRTYRRITGSDNQIALMVDSERGLGRPDRALELGRSVDVSKLDTNGKVQLAIAMSGARLDQGHPELALAELEIPQLDRSRAFSYSPALFRAYAAVLDDLGRADEAVVWEKAATRAETALAAAQHNEYETVEFLTEPNPDYVPPAEPEATASSAKDSEAPETSSPESATKEDTCDRASIEEQVVAEYQEILAEIDAAADPATEESGDEDDKELRLFNR